jgi:hypothetical protein
MKLGDTVAGIAHAVGIERKPGCGCAKRQEALNAFGDRVGQLFRQAKSTPISAAARVGVFYSRNVSAEIVSGEVPGLKLNGFMLKGVPSVAGKFRLMLRNGPLEFEQVIEVTTVAE